MLGVINTAKESMEVPCLGGGTEELREEGCKVRKEGFKEILDVGKALFLRFFSIL